MVFIETPASRAAWKTAAGAAETRAGSSVHAVYPIPFDDSRTNPIRQKATQPPISTLADRPGSAIPAWAPAAPDAKELLVVAILHSCAVSQGGPISRPIYEARRPLLCCMRNCGNGSLRTPVGDTPICVSFQGCATEKVGSGRRDLVKPLCHLLGFRVSGNPTSSSWQTHLVLAADW